MRADARAVSHVGSRGVGSAVMR